MLFHNQNCLPRTWLDDSQIVLLEKHCVGTLDAESMFYKPWHCTCRLPREYSVTAL